MCNECLQEISQKIKEIDVYILLALKDKTPQIGMVLNDIKDQLNDTRYQVYESLMRLEFIGAINYLKDNRYNKYYITNTGLELLEILNEQ